MMLITTLLLIVAVAGGVTNANDDGGFLQSPHTAGDSSSEEIEDKDQPVLFRMILHKDGNDVKICMGTEVRLTSNKVVWVTAAECLDSKKYDSFRFETMNKGQFMSQVFTLNKLYTPYEIHPKYNSVTKENNIAVMKRLRKLKDNNQRSSMLPETNDQFLNKVVDIFLQWKNVTTNPHEEKLELISIQAKVIDPTMCKRWYPFSPNKANNVCASRLKDPGFVKVTMGSPMIDTETQEYKLIGISTENWTRSYGSPIEFLSIEPYVEWLQKIDFRKK